jgi:3'-phosphoadenosine 5'-phosphosulfate sulfotransferase (PAPS reductase)/FAD synthetase
MAVRHSAADTANPSMNPAANANGLQTAISASISADVIGMVVFRRIRGICEFREPVGEDSVASCDNLTHEWYTMTDLPHGLDRNAHYIVGFSGGKDSVASWLYLSRDLQLPNVLCTFANTSHESIQTLLYMLTLRDSYGLPLVFIQPTMACLTDKVWGRSSREMIAERMSIPIEDVDRTPLTMENLSIIKQRFPSPTKRFCTTFLKLVPRLHWLSETYGPHPMRVPIVMVSGVRSDESQSRACRPDFEEHDPVFGVPLWLPIKQWTATEVFAINERYGIPVNPLYKQGQPRVGCFPCIMQRKEALCQLATRIPPALSALGDMESRVAEAVGKPAMSFFAAKTTPPRYRSQFDEQSGKRFAVAEDIRRWAMGDAPQDNDLLSVISDFEEDWTEDAYQCSSMYGLCE